MRTWACQCTPWWSKLAQCTWPCMETSVMQDIIFPIDRLCAGIWSCNAVGQSYTAYRSWPRSSLPLMLQEAMCSTGPALLQVICSQKHNFFFSFSFLMSNDLEANMLNDILASSPKDPIHRVQDELIFFQQCLQKPIQEAKSYSYNRLATFAAYLSCTLRVPILIYLPLVAACTRSGILLACCRSDVLA